MRTTTTIPGPGVHVMPMAAYHRLPYISRSQLWYLHTHTPRAFRWWMDHRFDEETDAMRLGRAVHTAILEPDNLESEFAVWEGLDRRTKAGKDAYAEFMERSAGKTILTEDQWAIVQAVRERMREAAQIYGILRSGSVERTFIHRDEETGHVVRVRPDFDGKAGDARFIVDLKTTRSLDTHDLERTVATMGYHAQGAMYGDVVASVTGDRCDDFYILWIANTEPVDVRFMRLAPEAIQRGREIYRAALRTYASCVESGAWPGYTNRIETLDLPKWAMSEAQ